MRRNNIVLTNSHGVFTIDHDTRTISIPHSVDKGDYPEEVTNYLEKKNYYKQLNIF